MRIAIVGGGIAGLGAAWALGRGHEVVVFERTQRVGGHALSVPLPACLDAAAQGQVAPVEAGFLLFDDWQYPVFGALLRTLRVGADPIALSVSYAGPYGTWSSFEHDTPLWRSVHEEAIRFSRDAAAIAMLPGDISLADYLDERGYSDAFRHACLIPLIGVLLVNRAAGFDIPARLVGAGFSRFFSFFTPTTCFRVRGGAAAYLDALKAQCECEFRLEQSVAKIGRSNAGVVVQDTLGHEHAFDIVILAVDAVTARQLLDDAGADESAVLDAARTQMQHVTVHTDGRLALPECGPWARFNYRVPAEASGGDAAHCTIDFSAAGQRAFVTWDAPTGAIDSRCIVKTMSMEHIVYSTGWSTHVAERFQSIQGVRRTWFCGGHSAGFPSHEGALLSGLAVAHALGAPYPFQSDRRAVAALNLIRRQYPAGRASVESVLGLGID